MIQTNNESRIKNIILTLSDKPTWDNRSSGTTSNLVGVTYGNNKFLIVGISGTTLTSSDGTSWTSFSRSGDNASMDLSDITYGNSTYVAVANSGWIFSSRSNNSWRLARLVDCTCTRFTLRITVNADCHCTYCFQRQRCNYLSGYTCT